MISESIRRRLPLLLFVLAYLLFTNITFKNYGETFDESGVYIRGIALAHYFTHDDMPGFVHKSVADDGFVLYDHFYAWFLSLLNPIGDVDVYHWLNLLFGALAFVLIYELLFHRTQRPWLSLLGPLFLALTPRFLGDIPANPKDMPFAVFYLAALALIYFFHQKRELSNNWKILALGLVLGLTLTSRLLGFSLVGVYLLFDLHFFFHTRNHSLKEWRDHLVELFGFLAAILLIAAFVLVSTWPYLAANFPAHFVEMLDVSKAFFWKNPVFFRGQYIPANQLPWTYLPVWFLITTPLFILAFCAASFMTIRGKMEDPLYILMGTAVTVNGAFYLFFHPVIYDGLRHFLFLLPLLVVIAALSAIEWVQNADWKKWSARVILALMGLNMVLVTVDMVRLHPYEYIYFNELTGGLKGAYGKFDTDYWGASFKEAVEWLEKNETTDPQKIYKITGSGNSYQIFYYFTPNLKWVDDLKDADYYLSYTRDHKQDRAGNAPLLHVVEREGVPLNYIYKLR